MPEQMYGAQGQQFLVNSGDWGVKQSHPKPKVQTSCADGFAVNPLPFSRNNKWK